MKVLFATYPMAFHTPGGGEIQLLAYKEALEGHGVQVDFLDIWNPQFNDYDVVHYFSCMGGSVHFCNFIKSLNIPLVVSSSLWITEETKEQYPIGEIRDQLLTSNCIITNSELESNELSKVLDIERAKFRHVYNGVKPIFFDAVDGELFRQHFSVRDEFVLNVANIEVRKNQHNLVRALKEYPEQKLVLIGHIRDQHYFDELMKLGGSQVVYLGPLEHGSELLRSAYSAAEAFVLPSTLETPGLAALEAFVSGTRVLVTAVGSTKEYFGDDAIYVDPDDIGSIGTGLKQVLKQDEVSSQSAKKFLWGNVVRSLIDIYAEIANVKDVR